MSGQLSRIKISGFRSIKHCELGLKNINVLIGSNGAGKSNFISVFTLLQNILSHDLQLAAAKSGINSMFYNGRKQTPEIGFEFFFDNNSYGFCLMATEDNQIAFMNEFFGFYGGTVSFNNKTSLGHGHLESKWEKGTKNYINKYVGPILKEQSWRVYHFHDTGSSARVKQEHNIANCEFLQYDAANLAAFLYRLRTNYSESYNSIVRATKLIAPYFDDFVLSAQEANKEQIVLKWRQSGCEDIFNASQLSDGTLRFICLATLLLQPKELQPKTIIIDEPELGLHPYAITMFADLVKQFAVSGQIIISTQSVELLNEFSAEDVIVANRQQNGSEFSRLNSDELSEWLEHDYALGELWKKNILGGRLSK